MRPLSLATLALTVASLACSGNDGPADPPEPLQCEGIESDVLDLEPYEGVTLRSDALACIVLAGDGASYIVAPQLTGASLPYGGYGYRIGDPEAATVASGSQSVLPSTGAWPGRHVLPDEWALSSQQRAERTIRDAETRMSAPGRGPRRASPSLAIAAPSLDAAREFSVLSRLDDPLTFARAGARLAFAGDRTLLYIDTLAAATLNGADVERLGTLFDGSLLPLMHSSFGEESDIDGNGRVIILLTPTVNGLVSPTECAASGYVRGFFFAHDLSSTAPTSNRGEIFYALVPDPGGRWSCPIATRDVLENIPPTLVHEMQHMISYGQHVMTRGGEAEDPWLNEGLSHLAEEIGSRYFEQKYPGATGRTDPAQLFPDSASAFITPNLRAAHRYLFLSNQYSITGCAPGSYCTLPERSAAWLFLRWLGDLKGEAIYRRLVQTSLTGMANVATASGEETPALLGDFTIALWADSIVGVPRGSVGIRHRFQSRNFRVLYRALYERYGPVGGIGRPFPIEPMRLEPGAILTGTMRPGTFVMYRVETSRGGAGARLHLAQPDGSRFPPNMGAQLSILRLGVP